MKDLSKKTKITIISILSVTVLLVAGITYAYFSAPTIGGNSGADTITFVTGTHGNIQVNYYNGNGTINMDNIDLKESEQGTTRKEMVKFSVTYPGNQEEKITIMWKEVFNNFCQNTTSYETCNNEKGSLHREGVPATCQFTEQSLCELWDGTLNGNVCEGAQWIDEANCTNNGGTYINDVCDISLNNLCTYDGGIFINGACVHTNDWMAEASNCADYGGEYTEEHGSGETSYVGDEI